MTSPARKKVWDYRPDEDSIDPNEGSSRPVSPDQAPEPAGPQRTDSRNSDKPRLNSRHNSRNNVPTLNLPYQFHERRNRSSTSLDSEALLHDHRSMPQSLPRASFLMPKQNGRRKSSIRNANAQKKHHRRSTLGPTNEAPESESDSSDSSNERTGLMTKQKQRRQSSSQHSNYRRDSDNYGATDGLSPPNPNYPPSIPSSFGSRRNSQEAPARLRESIAGKDDTGAPMRVTMAQRVLDYAHRRASTSQEDQGSDLAQLPDTISTSPPRPYEVEDSKQYRG
ncbi:hypothetical protein MRB53_039206 [Persea americana]|nr:hypothetical protein MRB53_039206 [Persea americana]